MRNLFILFIFLGFLNANDQIFDEIKENNLIKIRELVQNGAKFDLEDFDFAFEQSHFDIVKFFIRQGFNPSYLIGNEFEQFPTELIFYSYIGDLQKVRELIKNGAEVDKKVEFYEVKNETALRFAVKQGHLDVVKELVENGADIDSNVTSRWHFNKTILMEATGNGHFEIMKYLIEKGADLNAETISRYDGYQRENALIRAIKLRKHILEREIPVNLKIKIADFLIKSGSKILHGCNELMIFAFLGDLQKVKNILKSKNSKIDINAKNDKGETALIIASKNAHLEIIKYLIKNGADINLKDHKNRTALAILEKNLQISEKTKSEILKIFLNSKNLSIDSIIDGRTLLMRYSQEGNLKKVKELIKNGAKIDILDEYSASALFYASASGHLNIVEFLAKNGADLNIQSSFGYTPLIIATRNDKFNVVKFLTENGADLELKTGNNTTALIVAFEQENSKIFEYLVSKGANIDARAEWEDTLLSKFASTGSLEEVEYLAFHGADLNTENEFGYTPLLYASKFGHLNIIKFLIKNGVDINSKNQKGETALKLASEEDNSEIVKYLLKNGAKI
jgi:ankyrin repeat protein